MGGSRPAATAQSWRAGRRGRGAGTAPRAVFSRQQISRRARGLAGIVARGGKSADAAGDPLGGHAGHPAPPFATADLSVFPSGNHLVRFRVRVPGLADRSGVAGHGSFDGHPWPWLPINVLRCQMVNLHSFVVTGPMRMGWLGSELPFSTLTGHLAQQHSTDRLRAGGRRPWVLPRQR